MIKQRLKSLEIACLLVLGTFSSIIFTGCSKEIEPVQNEVNKAQRPKRENVVKYSFSMNGELGGDNNSTKAHWEDVDGTGGVTFFWDETTDKTADMQTLIYSQGNFINWDNGKSYSLAKVIPNANNAKKARMELLNNPSTEPAIGDKIYSISPINSFNQSSEPTLNGNYFYSSLKMSSCFENDGKENLNIFKDYAYIYSTSEILNINKNKDEISIQCSNAKFYPIPAVLRLSVKNNLVGQSVKVNRILMTVLKDGVETKVIPNSVCFLSMLGWQWCQEFSGDITDNYYSTLSAYVKNGQKIDVGKSQNFYMMLLPRDAEKKAYSGVTFKFEISATVNGNEVVYTINKDLSKLTNNNFASGYIYTFNLKIDSAVDSKTKTHYSDGDVVLCYESSYYPNFSRIIITGDGYTQKDLAINGKLNKDMDDAIDAIFSIEPYKSYKKYFQIYKMFAVSQESGASGYSDNSNTSLTKNTKFGVKYNGGSSLSYEAPVLLDMLSKYMGVNQYGTNNPNSVIILSNNDKYAGTCSMYTSAFSVSLCPVITEKKSANVNVGTGNLIAHEFCGHGFGRLGDEYFYSDKANTYIDQTSIDDLNKKKDSGMFLNISTDQLNHPWKDLAKEPKYKQLITSPEGAFLFGKGVWRCEDKSCMDNNVLYFSAYSRYLIYKRIKETAGESASLLEFMSQDDVATQPIPSSAMPSTASFYEEYPRLGEPIIIDVN